MGSKGNKENWCTDKEKKKGISICFFRWFCSVSGEDFKNVIKILIRETGSDSKVSYEKLNYVFWSSSWRFRHFTAEEQLWES